MASRAGFQRCCGVPQLLLATALLAHTSALELGCLVNATPHVPSLVGTNVIVSPNKEVTYQYSAGLPDLPADTMMFSYGPALSCEFDGIVTVAGPTTMDKEAVYGGQSFSARKTYQLFLDWINSDRGGLAVGNKRYGVRMLLVDTDSNVQLQTNATAHAIRLGRADFTISEYSSSQGLYSAKQSNAENRIMMTWGCSSTGVHSQNNLTFGIKASAQVHYPPTIDAILTMATEVDNGTRATTPRCPAGACRARIKFGFISQSPSAYASAMCGGAADYAASVGASVVEMANGSSLMHVDKSHSVEDILPLLAQLRSARANVLLVCTNTRSAMRIAEALEMVDYSPLAIAGLNSNTGTGWTDDVAAGWWQGEYWGSPTSFSPTAEKPGDFTGWSARNFTERFTKLTGFNPTSNDADAFGTLSALAAAVEIAGSIETHRVKNALESLDISEFWAPLHYDANHQNAAPVALVQALGAVRGVTSSIEINRAVAPPSVAGQDGPFGGSYSHYAFPMPSFGQRRCQYLRPDHPIGRAGTGQEGVSGAWISNEWLAGNWRRPECNGRGLCNDAGSCVCEDGFAGLTCDEVVVSVPEETVQRSNELIESLNCRTVNSSLLEECASTVFTCGATCTNTLPRRNMSKLHFNNRAFNVSHFWIDSLVGSGGDRSSHAMISCTENSAVAVSFATLSNNSVGEGGIVYMSGALLNISFSFLSDNSNTRSGSAGVLATDQSALVVQHTTFHNNHARGVTSSSSCIRCEDSRALVTQSDFAYNRGVAIMLSAGAILEMRNSAVHDNNACDELELRCATTSGIYMSNASTASISHSLFFNNFGGSKAGALFVSGVHTALVADAVIIFSNRGVSSDHVSGALMTADAALVSLTSCTFDNNLGVGKSTAVGAVGAMDAEVTIANSLIRSNAAQGNPTWGAAAGGIIAESSSITMTGCNVSSNGVVDTSIGSTFAKEFYAHMPLRVFVHDTVFVDFDDALSVLILPGISHGIVRGSCFEYPCAPGHSCSYTNGTLRCAECPNTRYSSRGITCDMCPAGSGPVDRRRCAPCVGNNVSTHGVCEPCFGRASDNHAICEQCPIGQIPKVDGSGCQCGLGTYNSSLGLITCIDQDYETGLFDNDAKYAIARHQLQQGLQCIACPPCVDCSVSPIRARRGFGVVTRQSGAATHMQNRTLLRCRPETLHVDAFGAGELATNYDGGKHQCLGGILDAMDFSCSVGHEGPLCATCSSNFGRKHENECHSCNDAIDPGQIARLAGILLVLGFLLGLILVAVSFYIGDIFAQPSENSTVVDFANPLASTSGDVLATTGSDQSQRRVSANLLLKTMWNVLYGIWSLSVQPIRIFLGYFQIAAYLEDVLHTEFPPLISGLFQNFKFLVADIDGIVALECAGLQDFHTIFVFEVVVLPTVFCLIVAALWAYRNAMQGRETADTKAMDDGFLVLFVVYPFVTNKLFAVHNCRNLSDSMAVLVSDYSIDCNSSRHIFYRAVSYILIVMFSMSVPIALFILLYRNRQAQRAEVNTPKMGFVSRRMMMDLNLDNLAEIQNVIVDLKQGREFGSLINAYRPGLFFVEAMDMIRKLLLIGFLTLVEVGTTTQVVAGVFLSFVFFAVHVKYMPFRHHEDNMLRATAEAHLFIVMLLVLTLRGDLAGEPLGTRSYDYIATILFIVCIPVAFALCIAHKWRRVVRDRMNDASGNLKHVDLVKSALVRHRLGIDKQADRDLLIQYIDAIENMSDSYHVFISYRVATDGPVARQLYDTLSELRLEETGQNLRVFLDQTCLTDGQRWDSQFMNGLGRAWIVCPIISNGAIESMATVDGRKEADNVLLEWLAALELHSRGQVKAIVPVITGSANAEEFNFQLISALSDRQHEPTTTACARHLQLHTSSADIESTDMLSGATQIVADCDANAVPAPALRESLAELKMGELMEQASKFEIDEEMLRARMEDSFQPMQVLIETIVAEVSAKPTTRGIVSAIMRFQGVKLSQHSGAESIRAELVGLKMGEILDKCADYGVDKARVQDLMNSSSDPIMAAIDAIVAEAPGNMNTNVDDCCSRVCARVSAIYQE